VSDYLRRGVATSGQRLSCAVTPTDGELDAATAQVAATVSG
jgi:hypothetical protein